MSKFYQPAYSLQKFQLKISDSEGSPLSGITRSFYAVLANLFSKSPYNGPLSADFTSPKVKSEIKLRQQLAMPKRFDLDPRPGVAGVTVPRLESGGQITLKAEDYTDQPHLLPVVDAFIDRYIETFEEVGYVGFLHKVSSRHQDIEQTLTNFLVGVWDISLSSREFQEQPEGNSLSPNYTASI